MTFDHSDDSLARAQACDKVVLLRNVMAVISTIPEASASRCKEVVDAALEELQTTVTMRPTIWSESSGSLGDCLDKVASFFSDRLDEAADSVDALQCRVCQSPLKPLGNMTWSQCSVLNDLGWHLSGKRFHCERCGERLKKALFGLTEGLDLKGW